MATSPVPARDNKVWFDEQPSEEQITKESKTLLETYSGIPHDEVIPHIVSVRNEAWEVFPYPCIGQFRFLEGGIKNIDDYKEIIQRIQQGQKFLDLGCCFGQTIRQLAADGAPSENMCGSDIQAPYIDLGYKLFKDREKLQSKFVVADIFDANSVLNEIKGQVDIIYTGSFFHLWDLKKQKEASKIVALLLRPQPGSMIVGRQVGAVEAREEQVSSGNMFLHNVESFQKLWKEIGDELGISFKVEAQLKDLSKSFFRGPKDSRRIWFTITRG